MTAGRKTVSITTGCYNEAENLQAFYDRWRKVLDGCPAYDYEFVIADNCSTDGSRDILRRLAAGDPRFKVILNAGNFGHIRSPYNAILSASGDLVVATCSDLQDPPEVFPELLKKYEEGYKLITSALQLKPQEVAYQDSLAWYYFKTGKYEEAANILFSIKDFGDDEIYFHKAEVSFALKDYEKAVSYYEKALKLNPKSKENKRGLAKAKKKKEKVSKEQEKK